eukprot:Trichotokara_eunicae@DN8909_c0_g1_i1.p1
MVFNFENRDEFLVLATDGTYDFMNAVAIINVVKPSLLQGKTANEIAKLIAEEAVTKSHGLDNAAVIVVGLVPPFPPRKRRVLNRLKKGIIQVSGPQQ